MKKYFSPLLILLAALLLPGFSSAATGQTLERIEFDSSEPGVDLITFKLNGAHLPNTFALKGELPRVIFDFSDVEPAKSVKNIMAVDGRFIKQIRTGIHRGEKPKTRVVLDLKSNGEVDFKQNFDAATDTLQISLFAAGTDPPSVKAQEADSSPREETVSADDRAASETQAVPEGQDDQHLFAAVPEQKTGESMDRSSDETTLIQPLSEIGEQENVLNGGTPPTLYSIEFDKDSHRGELIIFKLNNFNPPVVFGIEEDVPRIVCFFKDTSPGEELLERIESNGRFVKNIRVGKYRNPDNIRVVLDLVPNHNYDLQQVFFKEDNMFMIIINTAGEQAADQSS